jgi:hypothetical protein
MQARDQLNTALQTLMSNDSKLNSLHIQRLASDARDLSTDEDSDSGRG